jgi:hypothetical protein
MLQLGSNVDMYKMECNRMLKYNNIKMDLNQMECECVDCFPLTRDRKLLQAVVSAVLKIRLP